MPKTADKRARARRAARITRAHQTTLDHPIVRRARTTQRRKRPQGFLSFVSRYPWLTSIVAALIVVGIAGIFYTNKLGPFAPAAPRAAHQPSCDLKTHVCAKPNMTINVNLLYVATIKTAKGNIVIQMDPKQAPVTVNNFVYLADQHFYDGLTFWRVEPTGQTSTATPSQPATLKIIQGGDPKGDGTGGPGYSFKDENLTGTHAAGCVAMANSGQNTNGSQFFICTGDDTNALAASYNVFGQVISGLDVAQKIQPSDKMISVTIATQARPTATPATPTATAGK